MSILVVGVSHRSAPLQVLERAAVDAAGARALATRLHAGEHVAEAVVLATCNRLEVFAEVSAFHGGVADVGAALSDLMQLSLTELTDHLYVHYADHAVAHLFSVASGLDSMAVGESQVLGQVRLALRRAQDDGTVGRVLDGLLQQSLRVGKRSHAETGLDRAGRSLVEAGLSHADHVGALADADALVVGAGSMSALAATTLQRLGARAITIANRTPERAARLAEAVGGRSVALDDVPALTEAIAAADVVVSCTGSVGHVLDESLVRAARAQRAGRGDVGTGAAPQLFVDLALPRDVAPGVAGLDGVRLVGLAELGEQLAGEQVGADLEAARAIVATEVQAYLSEQRAAEVAPTVVALRAAAREVVDAELGRLHQRLGPALDDATAREVERCVNRVVDKLLHAPTVRVKSLAAAEPGGASYAAALRELFGLDLAAVASVSDVLRAVPTADAATDVRGAR